VPRLKFHWSNAFAASPSADSSGPSIFDSYTWGIVGRIHYRAVYLALVLFLLAGFVCHRVHIGVHLVDRGYMAALKVGVREFRERIATFLESDTPVAVTRRGETLGVYVPTRGKRRKAAELSELKAAADRLAEALSDVDEGELVAEFKRMRRGGKAATR
jgi:hypothetical protein